MSDLIDLERFAGEDPVAAEEAFVRLTPKIQRFLHRYLVQMLPRPEDREDVVSATLSKIWQRRRSFSVQGLAPWWSYVAKSGRRCALSRLGRAESSDSLDDDVVEESTGIEFIAQYADDRRRLYDAADRLWLKLDPSLSPAERKRRLLAAQMVFLHQVPAKEVRQYLGSSEASREEVDNWLASEPTLLDLAYQHLFWDNAELTGLLLRLSTDDSEHGLEWYVQQVEKRPSGIAPNGMDWNEVTVLVWRFQFGMTSERILARANDLDAGFVERVLQSAEARVPHCELARRLAKGFSAPWVQAKPLTNPGLWKRLVFQYCVHCGLPQKQIYQYTQPPAAIVGHKITLGMLNVWLSNGRLFSQLATFAQEARL